MSSIVKMNATVSVQWLDNIWKFDVQIVEYKNE